MTVFNPTVSCLTLSFMFSIGVFDRGGTNHSFIFAMGVNNIEKLERGHFAFWYIYFF